MYIKGIEFAGFKDLAAKGGYDGAVTLIADGTRIQIPLTLEHKAHLQQSKHRLHVLAKALQKAQRLPDCRGTLRFAPGVLPKRLRKSNIATAAS